MDKTVHVIILENPRTGKTAIALAIAQELGPKVSCWAIDCNKNFLKFSESISIAFRLCNYTPESSI